MIKTDKIKIVIFSGGHGASNILEGLYALDKTGEALQITQIVNGLDDGASGGIVRRVMNVLCPGDLRKNQFKHYCLTHKGNVNMAIVEFCDKRYDLTLGSELHDVLKLLDIWDFPEKLLFKELATKFFSVASSFKEKFNFFGINISNIIYASMINSIGYDETFKYFKKFFGIKHDVMLISEDNLQLRAITKDWTLIETETPGIIKHNNKENYIMDILFERFNPLSSKSEHTTALASKIIIYSEEKIKDADLIIFAPGTQWSSLIPTYATVGLDDVLKKSKAKKILIMNNDEDGDSIGRTAGDLLNSISKYLTLDNINIFINNLASEPLQNIENFKNKNNITIYIKVLGHGLARSSKTVEEIFKLYYNLTKPDFIFCDFDDTIYSRDPTHSKISEENLILLDKISKKIPTIIVSGNDYETIHSKLIKNFGSSGLNNIKFDIWADGGLVKYEQGIPVIRTALLDNTKETLSYLQGDILGLPKDKIFLRGDWPKQDIKNITCIGIKPLTELEKTLLINILNIFFKENRFYNVAKRIGLTGIDIISVNSDKKKVLHYYNSSYGKTTLYIGDELRDGNDENISSACNFKYNVKSPYDTNILLQLINEEL